MSVVTSGTTDRPADLQPADPAGPRVSNSRHGWPRFLFKQLTTFVAGAVFLLVVSFLMVHITPGDPVRDSLGDNADAATVEAKRAALGLDEPLLVQFRDYVTGVLHGDFGTSITTNQPVGPVLSERLGNTAELAFAAGVLVLVVAFGLGIPLGAFTASGLRRRTETAFNIVSGAITAIPEFLLASALVAIFSLKLGWLPASGKNEAGSLILPAIALAAPPAFFLARVVRLTTVKVLQKDYITTARSKQPPKRALYVRHVIPNVLTEALTIGAIILGGLVAGSVIVEKVFAWPGIGAMVVDGILKKDYPVVQACILVLGLIVIAVNLAVDLMVAVVNPKVVHE